MKRNKIMIISIGIVIIVTTILILLGTQLVKYQYRKVILLNTDKIVTTDDNKYSAASAQQRAENARNEYKEKIESQDVPHDFTTNEKEFFYSIMSDIRWDAGRGRNESQIFMGKEYCVWTDNIVEYLQMLGYSVDIENNKVSFDFE